MNRGNCEKEASQEAVFTRIFKLNVMRCALTRMQLCIVGRRPNILAGCEKNFVKRTELHDVEVVFFEGMHPEPSRSHTLDDSLAKIKVVQQLLDPVKVKKLVVRPEGCVNIDGIVDVTAKRTVEQTTAVKQGG